MGEKDPLPLLRLVTRLLPFPLHPPSSPSPMSSLFPPPSPFFLSPLLLLLLTSYLSSPFPLFLSPLPSLAFSLFLFLLLLPPLLLSPSSFSYFNLLPLHSPPPFSSLLPFSFLSPLFPFTLLLSFLPLPLISSFSVLSPSSSSFPPPPSPDSFPFHLFLLLPFPTPSSATTAAFGEFELQQLCIRFQV